jgi:hypothetical protein
VRTGYDSVNPAAIPMNAAVVMGYVDGPYAWTPLEWSWFPRAVRVRIATRASTNSGHVLDVEQGDATPEQAVQWVRMRRAAGEDPSVYCNAATWPNVRAAFGAAGVPEPHYWIAHYDGSTAIPAGAVAKQYNDPPGSGGDYDISAVADYWPGVDPKPVEVTPMMNLVLAQAPGDPAIWVGDGITRRHVPDAKALADIQHVIQTHGGDPTVQQYADLWVLGDPVVDVTAAVTAADGDVKAALGSVLNQLLTAIKAQASGSVVTEAQVQEIETSLNAVVSKAFPGYSGTFTLTPAPPAGS